MEEMGPERRKENRKMNCEGDARKREVERRKEGRKGMEGERGQGKQKG